MSPYQDQVNEYQPQEKRLWLAEHSEPVIPRALIADAAATNPATGVARPQIMEAGSSVASPRIASWRHWGLNE